MAGLAASLWIPAFAGMTGEEALAVTLALSRKGLIGVGFEIRLSGEDGNG